MPDGFEPASFGSVGYLSEDGIRWEPVGSVDESMHTRGASSDDEVNALIDLIDSMQLPTSLPLTVSWVDWSLLRKLLGLRRFDYVWAYRRWNKGHQRCRR